MRASRLLSLLLLLQARGRMTAQQLADELEVSVRTIYRDVESLSTSGVPLYGDPGPAGGYQLLDGYRTRLTGLSGDEAETLFLTGLPGPASDLGLGAMLATTQRKLMAALPEPMRSRAGRTRERFHLDPLGWYADVEETPHLAAISGAVWQARRLSIRYRRWAAPFDVTRELDPYGLVLKAGRWYLVARSGDDVRTYRVSQIESVAVRAEEFQRPEAFDLDAYWRDYLAAFDERRHQGTAVVRLTSTGLTTLAALADSAVRRAVESTAGEPDANGWVTATIPIESLTHATGELLRLGSEVEVLAPPELRARIAEVVGRLTDRYLDPSPAATVRAGAGRLEA